MAPAPLGLLRCKASAFLPASLLLLALPLSAQQTSKKCYALALSGGGDRGSFEAGVIQGLVERLPPEERQWNVITGVSAGSILASAGALFDLGDEVAMAEFMVNSTVDFTKSGVVKEWLPFGILQGLLEDGLYNTQPLLQTIQEKLGWRPIGNRNFTISTTDDITGDRVTFDESMVGGDVLRWATYVRASAAIPGLFETVKVDGHVFSDGGCVMGIDLFSAINRCRALVEKDEDIVLDIVTCDSETLKTWDASKDDHSLEVFFRGEQEKSYNLQMSDIFDACDAFPGITYRYYIEPNQPLPSNGFNFDRTEMQEMVQIGRQEAATAEAGGVCFAARQFKARRHGPGRAAGPPQPRATRPVAV